MDKKKAEKQYKEYKSNAVVYTVDSFKDEHIGNNDYKVTSKCGNYVFVYSKKDVEYIYKILEQQIYENYLPERSVEDVIFDDYEDSAFNKNRTPFRMMVRKVKEGEIYANFRHEHKNEKLTIGTWFIEIESSEGAKDLSLTPFSKPESKEGETEVAVVFFAEVPLDYEKIGEMNE